MFGRNPLELYLQFSTLVKLFSSKKKDLVEGGWIEGCELRSPKLFSGWRIDGITYVTGPNVSFRSIQ